MIDGFYAIDYQVHSFRSHDGLASIDDQCRRAVELGLDEIGFSEHKDFDPQDPVVQHFCYDEYMREIETARRLWGLTIRAGVEIDYQSRFEDRIGAYLESHRFDFVIGSVHHINGQTVMTPEYNRDRSRRTAYLDYFDAVRDCVSSGLFDIAGHLEYANRRGIAAWGPYEPAAYRDALEEVSARIIATGTALEINTAGLYQGTGVTYPTAATVALYAARGGKRISIGSDAHSPERLGHAYGQAARIALSNELTSVCTWANRALTEVPLRPDRLDDAAGA